MFHFQFYYLNTFQVKPRKFYQSMTSIELLRSNRIIVLITIGYCPTYKGNHSINISSSINFTLAHITICGRICIFG